MEELKYYTFHVPPSEVDNCLLKTDEFNLDDGANFKKLEPVEDKDFILGKYKDITSVFY